MKKLLSILLTVLLMLPAVMMAQTEVTVGTATTSNTQYPFNHCYEDSWSQSIYPASLINTAGTILEISFNCAYAGSGSFTSMHIYMGTTSSTGSSTFIPTTQLTEVYSGTSVNVGTTTGWQTFTLTNPFAYDGQSNLVVVVSKDQSGYDCDVEYYVFSGTDSYSSLIGYCDGTPTCAQSPSNCNYNDNNTYLPNIKLSISTVPITCPGPTGFTVASVNDNSADLTWTEGGTETSWDLYLATSATDIPDATSTPTHTSSTTSYTLNGLTSSTSYNVYVRANCGAGDVSSWRGVSFMTSQVAAQLPYSNDFEDATENASWTLPTSGTNLWYIGTAANNTTGGDYGLYISSDNGTTNSYNVSSTTNVWAYRDIDFDNTYAEYQISFDYKSNGESCCDYLKVFVGQPAEPSGAGAPAGATQLGGNMNMMSNWTNASFTLNSSHSGVQRLYFLWHNDGSVGTNPPGAIDNIVITGTNCGSPYNLVEGAVTTTTIPVTFTQALASDNAWEIVIVAHGDTIDETQAVSINTTSYEFTGLEPATAYDIYVRTDCGTEYSFWSSVLTVRTACPEYITVPFTENFDTYGTGSTTNFPPCWSKTSTYSSGYPYISSTYSSSAPGSMYFYAGSGSYTMCILPEVDPTIPVNTLSMSFKQRASGATATYAIQVGVMDSMDLTSFTTIATVYPSTANVFCEQEINFTSYTGTGQTIAFKFAPDGYYNNYIDDVSLYLTPTCLKPMNVAVSQITDNSVTVGWTARSGESAWSVVVVPAGDAPETGVAEMVYTNPCTISNLTDNTAYDVYVKADCGGGDESPWTSAVSFYTQCLPTDVIPFTESFDTYGAGGSAYYPNCWGRMTTNTSVYPYISSTHYDGVGSLYFYSSSTTYSLATSQALDLSNYPAYSLMLTFKAKKTSASYGRLDVGVMTDPGNLNTMTVLKSIYPDEYANTTDWFNFDVILPEAYVSGNVYLAFLAPAGTTNYLYLDTVVLDDAPTCMAPSDLEVSDIAGASAHLSWTAPIIPAASYTVEYSEANMENWVVASSNVTETQYTVSGLQPQTAYDVRVSSNCDAGETASVEGNFTTGCLAGGEIAIGNGTSTNSYLPSYSFYNYGYTQQIFLASELNGETDINSLAFEMTAVTHQRNLQIYLMHTTATNSSSWISASNAQLMFSGSHTMTVGWNEYTFTTPFHYNGTDNLALIIVDMTGSYVSGNYSRVHTGPSNCSRYAYQDGSAYSISSAPSSGTTMGSRMNVKFGGDCDSLVTCVAPVARIDAVDDESITISWVPGYTETSWEMEYKTANESSWTSQGSVSSSPVTLTGLTANTAYSVRLRSDCSGDYSNWVTLSAQTECSAIATLPYTQNFDAAAGSGASYFIDCWKRGTNSSTTYPYISSTYKRSGNYSLYFYGSTTSYCYAATPRFDDDIDMDDLQISFYAYKTSAAYNIEVGIMTDPTDYSTFQLVGTFSPESNSTWELAEIETDTYTGNGRYVAFRQPQYMANYMYIDDIDIHEIPFCGRVDNITASQITTTSATISWTPGGNEDTWEVVYGPAGTVDLTTAIPEVVTTPSIDLTGLNPSSLYDVYVRIDCGGGEYGAWTQEDFRTACGQIASLPFIENFDGYVASSSTRPACWAFPITYSNAPYLTTGQQHSSANSMFFQSATTSPTTAVTPQFDLDIHTLRVKFWLKPESTSYSGTFEVGVMSNPTNTATFESVQIIQPTSTNWAEYTVSFANTTLTGTGNYIAFRQNSNSASWYYWLDDVEVSLIPSCTAPTNLTFDNLSSTSVDVEWTDVATENAWEIYWYPANTTPHFEDAVSVSTNSYSLTNLLPATVYNVYVRTECSSGDGYSDYLTGTFTTQCEAISTLPYVMNFDNVPGATSTSVSVNNLPTCWSYYNNGTNTSYTGYPIVYNSSSYAASGSNSMRFYAYSTTYGDQYAILPPVDATAYPMNTLQLSFDARALNTSYNFIVEVGVMTNPTDPSTFQLMSSFSTMSTTYQNFECYFDAFTGTDGVIAMRARYGAANAINYGYVDNVTIQLAPSCRKPMNVAVGNITSSGVTITWAGQENNNFNIAIGGTANFDPDTCTLAYTTSATSYQVTGLSSNTTYYVKVQSDCGGGEESDWTDAVLFMTAANPAMVPYTSDFSDPTDVADWVLVNGSMTNKWYIGTPTGETAPSLFISDDNGVNNSYSISSTTNVWAFRDIDFGNFAEYELSFNWKNVGESCCDYVVVYIGDPAIVQASTTMTAPVGAVALSGNLNQQSAYTHFTANLDGSYANGVRRVYFLWHNDGSVGTNPPASIDSLQVIGLNCGRPHTLQSSNITTTTADITFVPAMSTDIAWEYAYGPAGSSVSTLTPVAANDTLIQLTGLSASSSYVVYVRTDCGSGEYSAWSDAHTFFTECDAVTIPYTDNFDTYGTGSTVYPQCWSKINTYSSDRPYINSTSYSSPGSMYFYAGTSGTYNIAITPEIDATYPVNTLQATFMYRASNSTDRMIVGVMTNPLDATTFVPVDTIAPASSATTWIEVEVLFNNYTGIGQYVAFKNQYTTTGSYGYIDNLEIIEAPTCPRPNGLAVNGTTSTSVSLSWTETGTASSWEIEYGAAGFSQGQGTTVSATTNPYTVDNLTTGTTYDFYVRAVCSATDQSPWRGPVSAQPGSYNMPASGTNTVTMCGGTIYDDGGLNGTYSNNCSSTLTVNPETAGSRVQLTGTYDTESSWDELSIYDGASTSGTLLGTYSGSGSISLTSTAGSLTLVFESDGSVQYAGFALQVTCVGDTTPPTPTCDVPTALAVSNITNSSASINWTAGGTETAWNLQYKKASQSTWSNSIAVTSRPYTLSNLDAETAYQVRVQANCGAGSTSDWTAVQNFTTAAAPVDPCNTPTNLQVTGTTENTATITWSAGGTENAWKVQYKLHTATEWSEATASTTTYTINGLTAATSYDVQVYAICSATAISAPTAVVNFTTAGTGISNVELANSISIMPNPAESYIELTVNSNVNVKEAAIYNAFGQLIQMVTLTDNHARIDVSGMAAGMYFVRIANDNNMATKKFIKR